MTVPVSSRFVVFEALTGISIRVAMAFVVFPAEGQCVSPDPPELVRLNELISLPEEEIDLGEAKLLIDHVIDPSVDVLATLAQLDGIAAEVRASLCAGPPFLCGVGVIASRRAPLAITPVGGISDWL